MTEYKLKDYKEISFTSTQTKYYIGTEGGVKFLGEEFMFLATQDCYVRFGQATAPQILIKKDTYKTFSGPFWVIYVVRKTIDGNLEVWSEGSKSR